MTSDQNIDKALILLTIVETILKIAQMRLNSGACIIDHNRRNDMQCIGSSLAPRLSIL